MNFIDIASAFNTVSGWLTHPLFFKCCLFLLILFVSHILKTPLTRLILKIFEMLRINHAPSAAILEEMLPNFILVVGLSIATDRMEFPGKLGMLLENACRSVVILYFFGIILKVIPVLIRSFVKTNSVALDWVIKLLRGFMIFVCATSVLELWGLKVGPIITGFGLFGAAVAFASKDLFENIISGAILIAENKFKKGDHVKIDDVTEGIVDEIRLRSTKIVRLDSVPVYVPNSKLASNSVVNYSMRPAREIYWQVGVTYDTKVEDLKNIRDEIEKYVKECDDFNQEMAKRSIVRVDEFGDSAINILVICFTKSAEWVAWMEAKERLAYKIMEIIDRNHSSFAFPSHSVYLEKMPDTSIVRTDKS